VCALVAAAVALPTGAPAWRRLAEAPANGTTTEVPFLQSFQELPDDYDSAPAAYVTLYTLGMLYTFAALAMVCDELFVPALECITEDLQVGGRHSGRRQKDSQRCKQCKPMSMMQIT